ncbi:thiol reductant ABC exporter subunit CydC [Roseibium sp. RKSG952]|uniref:thiol reductant ABC exporter subunit CydC n=1 Tax=Roseibium sp. RKSG952 TaxID=2529384 RepID=UPI0012BD0B87|nr:thiol reductant ABC exporter subunit CydC [Roseibium sp. RKSG952]MTH97570.1 thiol reductant ABC exporter subunit CydC [Roseibium sp. RKSG952]
MTAIFSIITRQWRHNRLAFFLGLLVAFVPALSGLALLGVSGWFITACAVAGLTGAFLNIFIPSAVIRGLAIARTVGRYGERMVTHDATFRFLTGMRTGLFAGQAARNMETFSAKRSGSMLNRLTSDVSLLDAVYLRLTVPFVLVIGTAALLCLWLAQVDLRLLAVFGAFVAVIAALVLRLKGANRQTARRLEAGHEAMRIRSVDLVAGRRDLAVYGGLDLAADRVLEADCLASRSQAQIDDSTGKFTALSFFAGQIYLAAMVLTVGLLIASGAVPVGIGAGVLLVSIALPEIIGGMFPGLAALPRIRRAAERADRTLVWGEAKSGSLAVSAGAAASEAGPVLSLETVSFGYPGAERQVLREFNLAVARGETVAITGRSGCGKSTVSALAAGLIQPASGRVLLDGQPVSGFGERDLRKKVTVLTQRPYLFHDTVAANLRIADPDAGDDALWHALERSNLAGRIRRFDKGLQTMLGEGGLGLSGGELRRLGLARAYLTRPSLWILDEMTEGLDDETAADVLDRFFAFKGDAAVLMIAHKPQEIARAQRIVKLPEVE